MSKQKRIKTKMLRKQWVGGHKIYIKKNNNIRRVIRTQVEASSTNLYKENELKWGENARNTKIYKANELFQVFFFCCGFQS